MSWLKGAGQKSFIIDPFRVTMNQKHHLTHPPLMCPICVETKQRVSLPNDINVYGCQFCVRCEAQSLAAPSSMALATYLIIV